MIKFKKSELDRSFALCKPAINKANVLPIFGSILINAVGGKYRMIASNQTYQVISEGGYEGDDFALCFDADKFGLMLSAASDEIDFLIDGLNVSVKSGKSKYKFSALPDDDFPVIDQISNNRIDDDLSSVLTGVYLNTAVKDMRYVLNGVTVIIKDGFIKSFASDGHCMAFAESQCESKESSTIIIPQEVAAIIANNGCESFCIDKQKLLVDLGNGASITSKLIDGNPFNFASTIPSDCDYYFSLTGKQLNNIASMAQKAGDQSVKLNIKKDGTILASTSSAQFSIESEMDGECNAELTESFRPQMLIMLCKIIPAEMLKIRYTSSGGTNKYLCSDGERSFLMMPYIT